MFEKNRELNDDTLLTRQRSLMSLCDYLHDPEHVTSAVQEGRLLAFEPLYILDHSCIHRSLLSKHNMCTFDAYVNSLSN